MAKTDVTVEMALMVYLVKMAKVVQTDFRGVMELTESMENQHILLPQNMDFQEQKQNGFKVSKVLTAGTALFLICQTMQQKLILQNYRSKSGKYPASAISLYLKAVLMPCRNTVTASTLITMTVIVLLQDLQKVIRTFVLLKTTMLCISIRMISAGQERCL